MKIPLFLVKEIKGKMGIDITSSAISPNTIGTLLVSMYIENHSSNKLDAWIEVNFMELLIDLNQRDYSFEKEDLYRTKNHKFCGLINRIFAKNEFNENCGKNQTESIIHEKW